MPWQHSDGVRHAGRNPDKCLPVQETKQQVKALYYLSRQSTRTGSSTEIQISLESQRLRQIARTVSVHTEIFLLPPDCLE